MGLEPRCQGTLAPLSGKKLTICRGMILMITHLCFLQTINACYWFNQLMKITDSSLDKVNGLNPGESVHVANGRSSRLV